MRHVLAALAAAACLFAADAFAQTDLVQHISVHKSVLPTQFGTAQLQCPSGTFAISAGWAPLHANKLIHGGYTRTNATGGTVDVSTLTNGASLLGGGFQITVQSNSTATEDYLFQVLCQRVPGNVSYARATTSVAPGQTGNLTTPCPAGHIATGTLSNSGQHGWLDLGDAPVWFSGMMPSYLGNATASQLPLSNGWEVSAQNTGSAAKILGQLVICSDVVVSQGYTFIYYYRPVPGSRYYMRAPLPDTHDLLGWGFDGFPYNLPYADFRTWHADWSVPQSDFAANIHAFDTAKISGGIRSLTRYAGDIRMPPYAAKAGDIVVMGVLALPKAAVPPAPTIATVVEFYNAALDHYFVTAAPAEISDLDTGVHVGWARTGQSFHAYAAGSTGPTGRQPVCRAYGNPAVGLDSHFYSAALNECFETLARFAGSWLLEADEVFQIDLPDTATGACPAGDIPVYRVFNNRADANHRYTISTAIRDQMVARGYIAEGYGPNSVTLCALP